jgi:3-oxoacyl-[acyl-carrier protein] reductase
MNPVKGIGNRLSQPARAVSQALIRPTSLGRNRPFYGFNLIDSLRGGSLEDAVRDHTVMLTGGSSGIGAATAKKIGAAGGDIVLVARGLEKLDRTAEIVSEAGGTAHVYPCDLSDLDAIAEMADAVIADLGGIDILVNNAAIYPLRPWTEITEEEWDSVLAVNLKGYFLCARACRDSMVARGHGRIVNFSSITYMIGFANLLSYVSSKGGVVAFTRALAREVGPDGITVNAIAPGAFPTDAEKIHPNPEQYTQWILEQQSLKRRGTPEDIGNAVVFLGSDAASFITGQTIVVDGGWAMH